VVAGASRIRVGLNDGREYDAQVIGADPTNDLAVLHVDTDDPLPWIPTGDSSDVLVGEPVVAIGNPFGFSNTVTTGVISATDRSINVGDHSFHGFLQTDASINPGNSGGPLLNAEGSLIGVNTAIFGSGQGIGFAIPIDAAKLVIDELIEHGELMPVTLGLDFQELDPALRQVMDLPNGVLGVLVNQVDPGGPADRGGLKRGDVIAKLDGRSVRSARDFFTMLETVVAGQELEMEVFRNDRKREHRVVAEAIPDNLIAELANRSLGVHVEWRSGRGFEIGDVRRRGPAEVVGIRGGDYLLAINGVPLDSEIALRKALLNLRGRPRALVIVQRGNGRYHVTVPLR
jgi:serine protease Do